MNEMNERSKIKDHLLLKLEYFQARLENNYSKEDRFYCCEQIFFIEEQLNEIEHISKRINELEKEAEDYKKLGDKKYVALDIIEKQVQIEKLKSIIN